ncbi:MAG: lipopolysaccharide biosynthesis protein [Ruminococcus sp.]|nr:lipopolysaccharide biosynthesis protein [Ruminococcus sp.]
MSSLKVFINFLWRFFERCGAQAVTLVVSIVLARILDPDVYGVLALVTVFTTILQVFVDSGLGNALIQKKDADDLDFSSVFYFNFAVCVLLYLLMFFLAPLIATFYGIEELTAIIRVISLTLIISGVKNIQQAYVSRNMLFKKFFFSTIGGTIGAAVVGIWMAYAGFGVWALVAQNLFNLAVGTLILWLTVKWRPKLMFSWERLKGLLKYGWKLLVSRLLDTVYNELRSLIIGKKYSTSDLAYYNKGKQFPNLITNKINDSIDSVLFPSMSKEQSNIDHVKSMARRAIKTSTYALAPLMMGMAFCAEPLIRLILTEKWLPSVFYLRVFCVTYMFYPIHTANLNAIKAIGRSDLFLKLEIAKKVVGMALLFASMWFGVKAIALSMIVQSVLSQIINSWPNKKLLKYGYLEQLKDIIPTLGLAVFMGASVYFVSYLGLNDILTLIIQFVAGVAIYILGSIIFKLESFNYFKSLNGKLFSARKEKEND